MERRPMSASADVHASGTRDRLGELVTSVRWETILAGAALVLIGLHILDDNFFQPQPGTSAGDHLVSGLVPFAVLLVFAAVYPRLRPGLRASIAAVVGLFGVAAGIEGLYYAHSDRLSGDDYTGIAAAAAGLLLIGVAATTLWRTRRRDDGVRWRWSRRALLAAGAFVVAYVLLVPFLVAYVLTHTARAFVPTPRLGAEYEQVGFTTSDGLRLRGWYVPSQNGAAVISFPGRKGTQKPARLLARHGYGVLLFDRRGEGESEGDPNGWGWEGYRDVDAAVRYLQRRPDVEPARIGGIGLSVGGEMMLEAAAKSRGLKAVVSEGAGERSIHEFLDMTDSGKWPALPSYAATTAGAALFSNDKPPPSLKDLVGRIAGTPVFFIYGEHGQDGERNLNPIYYREAGQPKKIWEVPGSGHVGGIDARPREYEQRVVGFFDQALLGQS
jgi:dienelactone hydrolase